MARGTTDLENNTAQPGTTNPNDQKRITNTKNHPAGIVTLEANENLVPLRQFTCEFLLSVLKGVEDAMKSEQASKTKTIQPWKVMEIQAMLQAYDDAKKGLDEVQKPVSPATTPTTPPSTRHPDSLNPNPELVAREVKALRIYNSTSTNRMKQLLLSRDNFLRWLIGNIAGVAVLWPMMVMVLAIKPVDTQAWPRIVIVTVATSGFATFVALVSSSSHQDLMTAVATYAAVLVVFVGTQTGVSGGGGSVASNGTSSS